MQEKTMRAALRTVAAVFVGLVVAVVLVFAVEAFGGVVHPLPEGFGGSTEEIARHVERYQAWVLAVVVLLWAVTALVSTWIAGRMGNLHSSVIVGLCLLAALGFNLFQLPYPMWFKIANLLVIPTAIVVGSRWSMRRKGASPHREQEG
jgi:hypothetical protein